MAPSDREIEELSERESECVEFKESLSDRQAVKRAICAFANDLGDTRRPGVVIIGLRDDGSCAGVQVTEELERLAASFRSDGSILPMPSLTVRRARVRDCDVLVLEVAPSESPPVRLSGIVYVRVGTTIQKATPQEERRLLERVRWHAESFDRRPLPGATLADLDLGLFERVYLPQAVPAEVLEANNRSIEQQLAALRLATPRGEPTVAGVLVVGRDPRSWLPGAYVQFMRFAGTELTDPIRDQKELDGPLPDILDKLDDILVLNIQTRLEISGRPIDHSEPD